MNYRDYSKSKGIRRQYILGLYREITQATRLNHCYYVKQPVPHMEYIILATVLPRWSLYEPLELYLLFLKETFDSTLHLLPDRH
jgi:hypothetical protein